MLTKLLAFFALLYFTYKLEFLKCVILTDISYGRYSVKISFSYLFYITKAMTN